MTANPAWEEIKRELRWHETTHDRPDLVARVFHIKFQALLKDLVLHGVLGRVIAFTYVIEFQKRGPRISYVASTKILMRQLTNLIRTRFSRI